MSSFVRPTFEKSINEAEHESRTITFDLSKLGTIEDVVESKKLKSWFVPAIFYWGWNNTIETLIDPQTIGYIFKSNFIYYSDFLGLSEKLDRRNLEITIEEIPTSFMYVNESHTIILFLHVATSSTEAISPQIQNTVISYRLFDNGREVKSGELEIDNKNFVMNNTWNSTKKFTRKYTEQFENNIRESAKEAVLALLDKI
jgi:hypothetical protein